MFATTHHFYTNLETVNHFTSFAEGKKTEKETYGEPQSTAPSKTTALLTTPKAHNQTSTFFLYKPEGRAQTKPMELVEL
jgi:hypothetical protein